MEELLGTMKGHPSGKDVVLYEEWAQGDWGLIITGAHNSGSAPQRAPADPTATTKVT